MRGRPVYLKARQPFPRGPGARGTQGESHHQVRQPGCLQSWEVRVGAALVSVGGPFELWERLRDLGPLRLRAGHRSAFL